MLTVQQLDDNWLNSKVLTHSVTMYSVRRRNDNCQRQTALVFLYPPGHQASASRTQLNNKKMRGLMALGEGYSK